MLLSGWFLKLLSPEIRLFIRTRGTREADLLGTSREELPVPLDYLPKYPILCFRSGSLATYPFEPKTRSPHSKNLQLQTLSGTHGSWTYVHCCLSRCSSNWAIVSSGQRSSLSSKPSHAGPLSAPAMDSSQKLWENYYIKNWKSMTCIYRPTKTKMNSSWETPFLIWRLISGYQRAKTYRYSRPIPGIHSILH